MYEIPSKDAEVYKVTMETIPKVVARITGDALALLGASTAMGGLEIARQHGGPWWILALQVTFFLVMLGWLQARYNQHRLPETTLPNGNVKVHLNWRPFLKSFAISLMCVGVAYFLAATVPQAIAAAECAKASRTP